MIRESIVSFKRCYPNALDFKIICSKHIFPFTKSCVGIHNTNKSCYCFKSAVVPPPCWVLNQPVLYPVRGVRAHVLTILVNCRCLDILLCLVNFGNIHNHNYNWCKAITASILELLNEHSLDWTQDLWILIWLLSQSANSPLSLNLIKYMNVKFDSEN